MLQGGDCAAQGNEASTEHTQRLVLGSVFWTFRFFGLDMAGFLAGLAFFWSFFFFGFFGCCFCNCCGRARVVQALTRRRRDAMPFMDMVQNRDQLAAFNPLLFLYPFCIISSAVTPAPERPEPSVLPFRSGCVIGITCAMVPACR